MSRVVLFVGAHPDDIEVECGGTVQVFLKDGYHVVGLSLTTGRNKEERIKRIEAIKRSSELLGYEPVITELDESDLTAKIAEERVIDLIRKYNPFIIFSPSDKDQHIDHKYSSWGADSAIRRRVKNSLHYAGPLREKEFGPGVFYAFTEEEYKRKLQAKEIHREAYGPTRYFTQEYSIESWLGQCVFEYTQRENAPHLIIGERTITPYAEWFEVRHLVNPFLGGTDLMSQVKT